MRRPRSCAGRACAEALWHHRLYGRPLARRFRWARGVVGDRRGPLSRRRIRRAERDGEPRLPSFLPFRWAGDSAGASLPRHGPGGPPGGGGEAAPRGGGHLPHSPSGPRAGSPPGGPTAAWGTRCRSLEPGCVTLLRRRAGTTRHGSCAPAEAAGLCRSPRPGAPSGDGGRSPYRALSRRLVLKSDGICAFSALLRFFLAIRIKTIGNMIVLKPADLCPVSLRHVFSWAGHSSKKEALRSLNLSFLCTSPVGEGLFEQIMPSYDFFSPQGRISGKSVKKQEAMRSFCSRVDPRGSDFSIAVKADRP